MHKVNREQRRRWSIVVAGWASLLWMAAGLLPAEQPHMPSTLPAGSGPAVLVDPLGPLHDLASAYFLQPLVRAGYVSSYDRTGGNEDGFRGVYSALYETPGGEQVILDLSGPGCLYTLWFTGPSGGYELPVGTLHINVDDNPGRSVRLPARKLFSGDHPSFPRPLVADSYQSTGGHVSYVPVPFAKRLVITTERRAGFYNAFYHLYPQGAGVGSMPGPKELSVATSAWNAAGVEPAAIPAYWRQGVAKMAAGAARVDILNERIQMGAVITSIRLNPLRSLTAEILNNLRLRIWWDDEESPSVDVPVGPLFGSGQGEAAVRSLPIGMSPSGPYYCRLPMPFGSAARVALEKPDAQPALDVHYEIMIEPSERAIRSVMRSMPDAASRLRARMQEESRFHAEYRQSKPTTAGLDHVILDVAGRQGVYLGHCLMVDPTSPENKKWWEGDLRVWVDGRRDPILNGTGHEDEFLGGWSSRWMQNPYTLPLHGLPSVIMLDDRPNQQKNGAVSAYRFFAGGIPFRDGVRVTTEHGTENSVETHYASVAYWYQGKSSGLRLTDTLDVGDAESEASHQYRVQAGGQITTEARRFDGDSEAPSLREDGRKGQRQEEFVLAIDPENEGVLLRRLYDQACGRHRATWVVNGATSGMLGSPDDHRVDRWREEDVILPPEITRGLQRLEIEIRSEVGEWNAFRYEVWLIPAD